MTFSRLVWLPLVASILAGCGPTSESKTESSDGRLEYAGHQAEALAVFFFLSGVTHFADDYPITASESCSRGGRIDVDYSNSPGFDRTKTIDFQDCQTNVLRDGRLIVKTNEVPPGGSGATREEIIGQDGEFLYTETESYDADNQADGQLFSWVQGELKEHYADAIFTSRFSADYLYGHSDGPIFDGTVTREVAVHDDGPIFIDGDLTINLDPVLAETCLPDRDRSYRVTMQTPVRLRDANDSELPFKEGQFTVYNQVRQAYAGEVTFLDSGHMSVTRQGVTRVYSLAEAERTCRGR